MIVECPYCGQSVVVSGLGRKRLDISLKIVCECLKENGSVKASAQELNCSETYIFNILKANGLRLKDVVKKGEIPK